VIVHRDVELVWGTEGNNPDFTFFNYSQVLDATNDFSVENKLGQGGFGPVYKVVDLGWLFLTSLENMHECT